MYETSRVYRSAINYFRSFLAVAAEQPEIVWGARAPNQVKEIFEKPIHLNEDDTARQIFFLNQN